MEYQRSRRIEASPGDVFDFVANLQNLPNFVPTVEAAETVGEDRIRLRGKNGNSTYEDDGWIHIQRDRHRIEWGDDEHQYSGWMTITDADNGATQVVTHLSFPPRVDASGRPLTGENPEEPDPFEEGLEAALDSLRNLIEGTGGKVQPAVTA